MKQVDQIREQLADQTGIPVTRTDALRMLINSGLKNQSAPADTLLRFSEQQIGDIHKAADAWDKYDPIRDQPDHPEYAAAKKDWTFWRMINMQTLLIMLGRWKVK